MWTGLYLIAGTIFVFGILQGLMDREYAKNQNLKIHSGRLACWLMTIGFWAIFFITIAYGINLIINS